MTSRASGLAAVLGIGLGFAGAVGLRWLSGQRLLRESAARLPLNDDGIVRGAEPIRLEGATGSPGVLLLHGFGDTPQTLSYLAAELHGRGYTVVAPLLPGHGRTVSQFARSTGAQWLDASREALDELATTHGKVGVVGLSMGGALAATLAAESPGIQALALIAPYCDAPRHVRDLARYRFLVSTFIPYLSGRTDQSILDPEERARSLGYGVTTPRLLAELVRVADEARAALPRVTVPALVLQSRSDNRLAPEAAELVLRELGSAEKHLEWIDEGGHIITVDHGRALVIAAAADWLDRWLDPRTATKQEA